MRAGPELVVDMYRSKCPKGYELEVKVVAPTLDKISVAQGGNDSLLLPPSEIGFSDFSAKRH